MTRRYEKMDRNTRQYRWYNVLERQITLRLKHPSCNTNTVAHFPGSRNDLIEHALRDIDDSDMVGMTNRSSSNPQRISIELTFLNCEGYRIILRMKCVYALNNNG